MRWKHVFIFWNYYPVSSKEIIFCCIFRNWRGRVRAKMAIFLAGTSHHNPIPKEKSRVFHIGGCCCHL